MSRTEFQSGQYVNGLFEFNTSERIEVNGWPVEKPGSLDTGDILEIKGKKYRLEFKRMEGKMLILCCDKIGESDLFYVKWKPGRHLQSVTVPVVADCDDRPGRSYLIRYRGKARWVRADDTVFARNPLDSVA